MDVWDGSLVKSVILGNQRWFRLVSHLLEWSHEADWAASGHCASGVGNGGQFGWQFNWVHAPKSTWRPGEGNVDYLAT